MRDLLHFSHFVASKSTFSYEFSLEPEKNCYLKINVSCEASVNFQHMSQNATPDTKFAPCRHLTQPCQCDLQKARNTIRLKCCAGHVQSAAPATKTATHLLQTAQKYYACHAKRLSARCRTRLNVTKCHACTRNEATTHWKPPKMTTSAELPIGTAIRSSRGRLRTVATTNATSSEHTPTPRPPE